MDIMQRSTTQTSVSVVVSPVILLKIVDLKIGKKRRLTSEEGKEEATLLMMARSSGPEHMQVVNSTRRPSSMENSARRLSIVNNSTRQSSSVDSSARQPSRFHRMVRHADSLYRVV